MQRYTAEVDKDFAFHEPDPEGDWVMHDDAEAAIAAAVAAERERCARVCESFPEWSDGAQMAAAIRGLTAAKPSPAPPVEPPAG
jgi:hypothetical protein